jgi:hypothetical protein
VTPEAGRFLPFHEPDGHLLPLAIEPRLESWDSKTSPSQIRLAEYITHVLALCESQVAACGDRPLAVHLAVGLPDSISLTEGGRDLDNYLFPIVRALGTNRVATARATKSRGQSAIGIGVASEADQSPSSYSFASAHTTASSVRVEWKHQIADQLRDQVLSPAPAGPLHVHVALRVGPRRNWAYLWKPVIDSLGCILGEGPRPFHPSDDRIVRLAFHRSIDEHIGNDVEIGVWWKPAI